MLEIDSKYTIWADQDFLLNCLEGLTQSQVDDLALANWQVAGESLYIGKIPKEYLSFDSDHEIVGLADNYFHQKKYKIDIATFPAIDAGHDQDLELFAKFLWLFSEYRTRGFVNPIGVHLNPRTHNLVIHPGGCRNKVLKMFHKGPIYSVFFNTKGYHAPWMDIALRKISIKDFKAKHPSSLGLVADHGSLIPHFLVQVDIIPKGIETWHNKIRKTLKQLRIKTNGDTRWLNDFVADSNHNVEITYKTNPPKESEFKGLVHMLSDLNYEDDYWSIRWI